MIKITTILTIVCLALVSCQKPGTYSESDMKVKSDSIKAQQILLDNLMHNCNSVVSELQARNIVEADSYEYIIKGVSDSLQIRVNKDYLNATILIVDGGKEITISYGNGRLVINNPYEKKY